MSDDKKHTLEVARDAWLEGRDFGEVLDGNGIPNEVEPDTKLPAHRRIALDWLIDERMAAEQRRGSK